MELTRRSFVTGMTAAAAAGAAVSAAVAADPRVAAADEASLAPATELNPQDESYDSYTTDFSALFSPIQVGTMTLRNRICKSAAGSRTTVKGQFEASQHTLDYYGGIADGGCALIVCESGLLKNYGFNPNGPEIADEHTEEEAIEQAKRISDRVHEGGAYIGYQMSFGGLGTDSNETTIDEIEQFFENLKLCLGRLVAAGYDFVEFKGATTDAVNALMSRRQNIREDEYGPQTMENRIRLLERMVTTAKEVNGADFPVLVLINGLEENDDVAGQNDKFLTHEEACWFGKRLEDAGADAIQVRVATPNMELSCWAKDIEFAPYKAAGATGFGTQYDYATHFQGLMDGEHSGAGIFIPLAASMKQHVSVPVGCANYMDPRTTPDLIDSAVAEGKVDLVFMTRALNVDHDLPRKLQEGRRDEVRPCMRCLHCHGNLQFGAVRVPEFCRANPVSMKAYGEDFPEGYVPTPAETPKKVIVVGAGPAGMEAAIVAAQRGHDVTLIEKNAYLGGKLLFANAIKGSHERLMDFVAYLTRQLELAGVEVVTGEEATAESIAALAPDAVILACGGQRAPMFAGEPGVVQVDDVVSAELGEKIVILGANVQATDIAAWLIAQGKKVQLVHGGTAEDVDAGQSAWMRLYMLPYLYAKGVRVWNGATVEGLAEGGVQITSDSGMETFLAADTVIECEDDLPNTVLADELAATGVEVVCVGDCAEFGNIQRATYTGNIAGRRI